MCSTLVCEHKYSEDMPLRSYEWRCKMREMGFFLDHSRSSACHFWEVYNNVKFIQAFQIYISKKAYFGILHVMICTYVHNKHTHQFNGNFFPGVPTWASNRKVKPIWILLKQLTAAVASAGPYIQVCTSLQTDNHASTTAVCYFYSRMPFLPHNQQHHSIVYICTNTYTNTHIHTLWVKKQDT